MCDIFIHCFLFSPENKSKMRVHNSINRFLGFIVYSFASISSSFACQVASNKRKLKWIDGFFRVVIQLFDVVLNTKCDSTMKRCAWCFMPPPGKWYGKLIEHKFDINESKKNEIRYSFIQNQFYNLLKWYLLSNVRQIGDVIIVINLLSVLNMEFRNFANGQKAIQNETHRKNIWKKPHYN